MSQPPPLSRPGAKGTTYLAGKPALRPFRDVAHLTSGLGIKEGQSCVHIACSSCLLEKKSQEENWPQIAEILPAQDTITR